MIFNIFHHSVLVLRRSRINVNINQNRVFIEKDIYATSSFLSLSLWLYLIKRILKLSILMTNTAAFSNQFTKLTASLH